MKEKVVVRQEGTDVLLLKNGQCVVRMPWKVALELSRAFRVQGKKAEEIDKHELIIKDAALIRRLGINIGLTSHPKIQNEVKKEAYYDKDLRRYIPHAKPQVQSKEVFGVPDVRGK